MGLIPFSEICFSLYSILHEKKKKSAVGFFVEAALSKSFTLTFKSLFTVK